MTEPSAAKGKLLLAGSAYVLGILLLLWSFLLSDNVELKKQLSVHGVGGSTTSPRHAALAFGVAVLVMGSAYAALLRWAARGQLTAAGSRPVWALVGLLVAIFTCMPPFLSVDVFSYYQQGWVVAEKAANPGATPPGAFGDFPAKQLMKGANHFARSPYGPAWTQLEAFTYLASGKRVWPGVLLFKIYAAAATMIVALTAGALMSRASLQHELEAVVFVGANPLILIEAPGMGHNDIIALAALALGVWLQVRLPLKRWAGPLGALAGSLIKMTAVPAAAVMFYWAWKKDESSRNRLLTLTKVIAPWLGLLVVAGASLVTRMADVPLLFGWANASLGYEIRFTPVNVVRDGLAKALHGYGFDVDPTRIGIAVLAVSLGIATAAALLLVRRAETFEGIVATLGPAYLLVTVALSYWRPWYVLWPVAAAAMGSAARWKLIIAAYSLLALATYVLSRNSGMFCC